MLCIVLYTMPAIINAQPSSIKTQNEVRRSVTDEKWHKGGLFYGFTPEQEVISKRDANSKHFLNIDGTITAVISQAELHYKKNESSPWEDIRTDIRANESAFKKEYSLAVTENKYQLYFSDLLEKGHLIHLPTGEVQLGTQNKMWLESATGQISNSYDANN